MAFKRPTPRAPAVACCEESPEQSSKSSRGFFLPRSGTINSVVRSLWLQWSQAGRPFWQMELAPPLAGPFALRLTLHHHRRKLLAFALRIRRTNKGPLLWGLLWPLTRPWAGSLGAGALAWWHRCQASRRRLLGHTAPGLATRPGIAARMTETNSYQKGCRLCRPGSD